MGDMHVEDLLLDVVSCDWASQHALPIDKSPIPNLAASLAIPSYRKLHIQIRTVKKRTGLACALGLIRLNYTIGDLPRKLIIASCGAGAVSSNPRRI